MPDFNAKADIYRVEFKSAAGHRPIAPSKPIRSGTVAEGVRWIMAKRPDDRKTYFMTVALEAGFLKGELSYRDIEDISNEALPQTDEACFGCGSDRRFMTSSGRTGLR